MSYGNNSTTQRREVSFIVDENDKRRRKKKKKAQVKLSFLRFIIKSSFLLSHKSEMYKANYRTNEGGKKGT